MAGMAEGRSSVGRGEPRAVSSEDIVDHPFLVFGSGEALSLEVEHGAVTAAKLHQLVVGAELNHAAVFDDADAVGLADGGEAVGDEDGGAAVGGLEDAFEDLGLAAHI